MMMTIARTECPGVCVSVQCSTECGLGERTRGATCVNGEGQEVPASRCTLGRPQTRQLCDMGSCAKGWYYTRWSKDVSVQGWYYTRWSKDTSV